MALTWEETRALIRRRLEEMHEQRIRVIRDALEEESLVWEQEIAKVKAEHQMWRERPR